MHKIGMKLLLLSVLMVLSFGRAVEPAFFAPAQDVSLADDAYHYREFADGKHDNRYIEWWYFNFYDTIQDLQGIFAYFVANPEKRPGPSLVQVVGVVYTSQGVVSKVDIYRPEQFTASYEKADVQIEANTIRVIDGGSYRIVGASRDARLKWDLLYISQSAPWYAANRMNVGRFPWEQMSWLIYMPRADVTGQIELDGQVYQIRAPGYHDHNWGEWNFTNALWNWAQYSEPGLALEIGDFIGQPVGVASVDVQGQRNIFTKKEYELTHTRWAYDAINRKQYPIETTFRAENEAIRVALTIRAINTHPLRGRLPFPLPEPIIYEQTAQYTGQLWQKNASGQWQPLMSFSGNGFKEYTAKAR
ncbi:MAG: hypothetical protein RMM98_16255 [Acidobacteriota bacterium]|nr:hypothetical protein [Blastocatellia bacterium]MDW8241156.1 hypothetical protein [Acidobacteriota bacterium]